MGFINLKYLYIYLSIVIGVGGRGGDAIFLISYYLLCNGICSIKIYISYHISRHANIIKCSG